MDGFNRVLGIVVGLFVVLLLIGFLLGRFNKGKTPSATDKSSGLIGSIFKKNTPTPTPTSKTVTINTTSTNVNVPTTRTLDRSGVTNTATIPATGSEMLVPLASALLAAGFFIRKQS